MALTAHYIENGIAKDGQKTLNLKAELIGFHKLPGRHTGAHLAQCFFFLCDRIKLPMTKVCKIIFNC
jgi:hypothetical protein